MLPEVYARKVADDFELTTLRGKFNVYRGKLASLLGFLMLWCPRFLVEWIFIKTLYLTEPFRYITQKYAKTNED